MSIPESPVRRRPAAVVLDVVRTERLTPHLTRVHLGGTGFDDFLAGADPAKLAATDKYVKILFAKPELGLEPPYDLDALRERLAPDDMPVRRTYTVRSVDTAARTLAIDFVVHGDEGIAGPWAANARPGDWLTFSGPGAGYTPSADASIPRLLAGDDSAIPAIAAVLESLPAAVHGLAVIEVGGPEDEIELVAPAGVEVRWLHRRGAHYGSLLTEAIAALEPVAPPVEVFVHGEREAMKSLRRVLHDGWGLERRGMSLSAYWAFGRAEDGFQAEKHEPVGQIFED